MMNEKRTKIIIINNNCKDFKRERERVCVCGQQHTSKNIYITNYYSSSEIILHFRCCISSLAIAKLVVFNSSLFFLLNEDACNYFYANFECAATKHKNSSVFCVVFCII